MLLFSCWETTVDSVGEEVWSTKSQSALKKKQNKTSDNESQRQHVPTLALTGISLVSDSCSVSPYLAAKKNKIHLNRFRNAQGNFYAGGLVIVIVLGTALT